MNHERSQLGQTIIEKIQQCEEPHGKKTIYQTALQGYQVWQKTC